MGDGPSSDPGRNHSRNMTKESDRMSGASAFLSDFIVFCWGDFVSFWPF